MGLKIAIPKEIEAAETRVAASPDTVKKLTALGCSVVIETGAGEQASFTDSIFTKAGAKIVKSAQDAFKGADIILKVQAPSAAEISHITKGTLLVALLAPYANEKITGALAKAGIDGFSMELVPRITRAQSMDVLSSQSNLAGYKAVLDAAEHYTRALPMMMTAAGTIAPARIFIMGAGVAGLQAIATARRLGAVVSATDVRPAAKEQVESLGASFVAVEDDEFKQAETSGGYAKEMSKDYQAKQAALVEAHIAKQDIVITTALIPGRPAPKLISEKMLKSMKPGSVIVDMAAEAGGNCALSQYGEVVSVHDLKILGHKNIAGRLATDSSALYARNLFNLLNLVIDKDNGKLAIDWEDDIIKGIALTKDGAIIHPNFLNTKTAKPKEKAEPKAPSKPKSKKTGDKKSPAKKAASSKNASKTTTKKQAAKKTTPKATKKKTAAQKAS